MWEVRTDSVCGKFEATLNLYSSFAAMNAAHSFLTARWKCNPFLKTATLTHHSPSFRTCYSLTRDMSLSLSPSLYSSSSVSHAVIYPTISEKTRETGKIIARQLTRIHDMHTVLLPSNTWTGARVSEKSERNREDGAVRRWTGVLMNVWTYMHVWKTILNLFQGWASQ